MQDQPYVEILTPPGLTVSEARASWTDDIRIIPMSVEEMCLEEMPSITVDLSEDERDDTEIFGRPCPDGIDDCE